MHSCSVILLTYNSTLEQIVLTLESVIKQKNIHFEIILADDHSTISYEKEISKYFKRLRPGYTYKYIRQNKNVGTVRNLYSALLLCKAEFVKIIGAGDALFDEYVLSRLCEKLKRSGATMGFGLVKEYSMSKGKMYKKTAIIPNNLHAFIVKNEKEIFDQIVKYEQYITGVAAIYNVETIKPLFEKLLDKVIYCEDMVSFLVMLEKREIDYIPINSMWYEQGTGIDSSEMKIISPRIRQDQIKMYQMVAHLEKNFWRKWGKKIIHKIEYRKARSLLKIIFQPGILVMALKTKRQIRKGIYDLPGEGFLDDNSFILNIKIICQQIQEGKSAGN